MSWRWVPPAFSPVSLAGLLRGALSASGLPGSSDRTLVEELSRLFAASKVTLTDSGTSALAMAMRVAVPAGAPVALPAYSCIDLVTAAQGAGVKVRLYDLDPSTLSPDLASLRQTVQRGVGAIVLAPLFGYAVDVTGVSEIAAQAGIPLIEDAAQSAGAEFRGKRVGAFGTISILSFARGKGTTGGSGGALLVHDTSYHERADQVASSMAPAATGWSDVLKLSAQWILGRPSLYRIPSSMPGLRLGEMIYHAPHAPRQISRAACTVLDSAMALNDAEVASRRLRAQEIQALLMDGHSFSFIKSVTDSVAGFLRLAVLDMKGRAVPVPRLGILRGYPLTLDQHPMSRTVVVSGETAGRGARELRDQLFTLPVHSRMNARDVHEISAWFRLHS